MVEAVTSLLHRLTIFSSHALEVETPSLTFSTMISAVWAEVDNNKEANEQQAAKHSSVVAIAAELHTLEAEVVEMARRQSSVLATKRREALKMSLQLRGAAAKEAW